MSIPTFSKFPLILIDGLPFSGGTTLSSLLASTYSLQVMHGTESLMRLFEQAHPQKNKSRIEYYSNYIAFLNNEVKSSPQTVEYLYSFFYSTAAARTAPLIIHASGIINFMRSKNLSPDLELFLDSTQTTRIERLMKKENLSEDMRQSAEIIVKGMEDIYTYLLQTALKTEIVPQNKEIIIDTNGKSHETVFSEITAMRQFELFRSSLEQNMPEVATEWRRWKCLQCGLVTEGAQTLTKCPRCGNSNPDRFEDVE
jgi:rubrerythrin